MDNQLFSEEEVDPYFFEDVNKINFQGGSVETMDFWFSIGLSLICYFCLFFFALFHIANLAHPKDTTFGASYFARVIAFTGIFL